MPLSTSGTDSTELKQQGGNAMSPSPRGASRVPEVEPMRLTTEITIHLTPFDQKKYRQLIEARGETIQRVVTRLKPSLGLSNAVDAGCGVGFFSQTLLECGLNARVFVGLAINWSEPHRRLP